MERQQEFFNSLRDTRISASDYFRLAQIMGPDIVPIIGGGAQAPAPGQALPAGGMAATQPVPPTPVPNSVEDLIEAMTPTVAKFRAASTQLTVPLDQASYTSSSLQKQVRIASVGLGFRTISKHAITFSLANTATAAQVVLFSPHFPWCYVGNTQVKINGGAQIYSVGGVNGLNIAMRDRKWGLNKVTSGGFGPALPPSLVTITTTNATVTNGTAGTPTLGGIASISIAASTTATVTVTFYTFERLAMDRMSLLGALPLQSNSTFATLTRTLGSTIIGVNSDARTPFSVSASSVPGTLAGSITSATSDTDYWFASIPADPSLYAEMIANSFQCIEQTALPINSNATQAFKFNVDQNELLACLHFEFFDNNGATLGTTNVTTLYLQYNAGTIQPAVYEVGRNRAYLTYDYGDDRIFEMPGYRIWNGYESTESLTDTDQQQWLDTYFAAQPQALFDTTGISNLPANVNVAAERIVIGGTNVIGG